MADDTPILSVVIPTLDGGNYVLRLVDDLLRQIRQDELSAQLIVSDNRSSDGTYELLTRIDDPRLILVQPDSRLCMAGHWYFVLQRARGQFIYILGSDDGFHAKGMKRLIELVKSNCHEEIIRFRTSKVFWPSSNASLLFLDKSPLYFPDLRLPSILLLIVGLLGYFRWDVLPGPYQSAVWNTHLLNRFLNQRIAGDNSPFGCPMPDHSLGVYGCLATRRVFLSRERIAWSGSSGISNNARIASRNGVGSLFFEESYFSGKSLGSFVKQWMIEEVNLSSPNILAALEGQTMSSTRLSLLQACGIVGGFTELLWRKRSGWYADSRLRQYVTHVFEFFPNKRRAFLILAFSVINLVPFLIFAALRNLTRQIALANLGGFQSLRNTGQYYDDAAFKTYVRTL